MGTPLIVIDPKARKAFTRGVAALEDAAADGNTWGPDTDARILANTLLAGARLNQRDRVLLCDCVQSARDDLAERLREHPEDYEPLAFAKRRLAAMDRLLEKLT